MTRQKKRSRYAAVIMPAFILFVVLFSTSLMARAQSSSTSVSHSTTTSQDWTSFIFDYNNSRYQASSTITSANVGQLAQKWMFPTYYPVTSTPIVENGSVYFADWGGNVYSLNIADGSLGWKVNVGIGVSSTLALSNGLVYVSGSPNGPAEVLALNQTSGKMVWTYEFHSSMTSIWASPVIYNDRLFVGLASSGEPENESSMKGEIDSLNATTGNFLWNFETMPGSAGGAAVWGSVAVDPKLDAIYFGTGNAYTNTSQSGSLYSYSIISLDASTGNMKWYHQIYSNLTTGQDLDFGSTPNLFTLHYNGKQYQAVGIGNKDGAYYILDRTNGQLISKYQVGTLIRLGTRGLAGFVYDGAPSKGNPVLFIPSTNVQECTNCRGVVEALFPSNGTVAWKHYTTGQLIGSVAIAPGVVFVGDTHGVLYAISTASNATLYRLSLPHGIIDSGITVAEGHVLFGVYGETNGSSGLGVYALAPSNHYTLYIAIGAVISVLFVVSLAVVVFRRREPKKTSVEKRNLSGSTSQLVP